MEAAIVALERLRAAHDEVACRSMRRRRRRCWARLTRSPGQRIVLHARDQGCIRPGCTAPGYWCQVHHVKGWTEQDGATEVNKLTLACGPDNRRVGAVEGAQQTRDLGAVYIVAVVADPVPHRRVAGVVERRLTKPHALQPVGTVDAEVREPQAQLAGVPQPWNRISGHRSRGVAHHRQRPPKVASRRAPTHPPSPMNVTPSRA